MSARTNFEARTTGVSGMSSQKVIVAGWYTVDPSKRDEVVETFKDMVLRARSTPGCLDMAITADPVDSNRINMFEFWRSEGFEFVACRVECSEEDHSPAPNGGSKARHRALRSSLRSEKTRDAFHRSQRTARRSRDIADAGGCQNAAQIAEALCRIQVPLAPLSRPWYWFQSLLGVASTRRPQVAFAESDASSSKSRSRSSSWSVRSSMSPARCNRSSSARPAAMAARTTSKCACRRGWNCSSLPT